MVDHEEQLKELNYVIFTYVVTVELKKIMTDSHRDSQDLNQYVENREEWVRNP